MTRKRVALGLVALAGGCWAEDPPPSPQATLAPPPWRGTGLVWEAPAGPGGAWRWAAREASGGERSPTRALGLAAAWVGPQARGPWRLKADLAEGRWGQAWRLESLVILGPEGQRLEVPALRWLPPEGRWHSQRGPVVFRWRGWRLTGGRASGAGPNRPWRLEGGVRGRWTWS